tara:strand:- start:4 stop:402 length:399 start_codon:yes stop_codon:yes gene_type:complete
MSPTVITGLFEIGKGLINKWFPDPEEASKREAELSIMLINQELEVFKTQAHVISTESRSEHFLVSAWRPITMLVFVFIIANNYILAPYIGLFFGVDVSLDLPPDMWDLLKIGLGGYVVGRSSEKAVKAWKDR